MSFEQKLRSLCDISMLAIDVRYQTLSLANIASSSPNQACMGETLRITRVVALGL